MPEYLDTDAALIRVREFEAPDGQQHQYWAEKFFDSQTEATHYCDACREDQTCIDARPPAKTGKPGIWAVFVLRSGAMLLVFPGGGMTQILNHGADDNELTRFQIEFRNADDQKLRQLKDAWASVLGPGLPWWFNHSRTRYEPCYFEADGFNYESRSGLHHVILRLKGLKKKPAKGE